MEIKIREDIHNNAERVTMDGMTATSSPDDALMADAQIDEALAQNDVVRELVELFGFDREEIRRALLACEG